MINKDHIREVFREYTDRYDSSDTKIKLKIDHTYRVSEIAKAVAESLNLSEQDVDMAWLIGMLHDIGRFEQVRRYGTFSDAVSIDHAQFGADLLFKEGLMDDFSYQGMDVNLEIVEKAIRNHSAYRIEDGLDDRTTMFCNIIRDADKIDILKVNTELPLEEIYNVSTEDIENAQITKEVLEAFYEEHAVLRSLKKSSVDHVVGHISLVYELVYPESYRILDKQGYIYKLMGFESLDDKTKKDFEGIRNHMTEFIGSKMLVLKEDKK